MKEMKLKCGEILTVGESLGIPGQEKENYGGGKHQGLGIN